jgi:hypothetical protein
VLNIRFVLAVVISIGCVVCGPATVMAQPSTSWAGLKTSDLQTVFLLDRSGVETTGKLLAINPDSLLLLVDGDQRRFEIAEVARLQKRDSLRNGAIVGAVVGVAMGLVSGGISDCSGADPGGSCPGLRATLVAVSTGVYAAIGTGIDALIRGRTTIYAAPSTTAAAAAMADRRRVLIRASVSW